MPDATTPRSGESHSQRVLKAFFVTTASSFAVLALSFLYATVTSRLLPPSAFGAFAVAFSWVGLLTVLGGSSLGLSAARRDYDSVHLDRSLVTLSAIIGGSTALVGFLLAPLWGGFWGIPESTEISRVLVLSLIPNGVSEVLAGIMRRHGLTSSAAMRTATGQILGILVGFAAVLLYRTPWSLAVALVVGPVLTVALLAFAVPGDRMKPTMPTAAALEDVLYAMKYGGMNVLRYGTNLVPIWSVGRFSGSASLGAYNRATTLLTNPLLNLQRSFSYTLFPELRPNGPVFRSPTAFTDVLILVTWPAVFLGGIGYFAAPPFISLVLGPTWSEASALAGVALLLGVVPIVSIPLGSALEALGRFWVTWLGWLVGAIVIGAGALFTALSSSPLPAMLGVLAATTVGMLIYFLYLSRAGLISLRRFYAGTKVIVGLQTAITILLAATRVMFLPNNEVLLAMTAAIAAIELVILWLVRRRTTFGVVARRYNLPGFGSEPGGSIPSNS